MASVANDPNGTRRILFVNRDNERKAIRLGKCPERTADAIRIRVEDLLNATIHGQAVSRETAAWVAGIGDKLHDRLARAGLVEPHEAANASKLGAFIEGYIKGRVDAKPRTIINLNRAKKALVDYFKADKPLAKITAGDADAFRLHLLGKNLAENTVRRICGRARQFFRAAIRRDLLHRNPFDGIKCAVGANGDRVRYVSREDAGKVLAACPNAEWRLIFALSRYAGLRCPSEHLALRWGDVDWEHNRMTVRSPKTEHHEGKASRVVPIFPELFPYLRECFELAEPGTEHVITRYRSGNANLRTQLERIIRKAGLEPWPKLFHNLRATRETELAESFPLHVVCAWIGNSQPIAAKHYLQVTDDHFLKATGTANEAAQKAAQKAAQHTHAEACTASHDEDEECEKTLELQANANTCETLHAQGMPPEGLEPSTR